MAQRGLEPIEAPTRPRRRWWITAGAAVLAVLVATGVLRQCTEDVVERETIGTFFDVPRTLPERPPGTLIRTRRLLGAPNGSVAWRVLYHSTDRSGRDIAVSGIVVGPPAGRHHGGTEGVDAQLLVAVLVEEVVRDRAARRDDRGNMIPSSTSE